MLHTLQVEILWKDGSLNWSNVVAIKKEGLLYEPGLTTALLDEHLRQQRATKRLAKGGGGLLAGDPLNQKPSQRTRGRGRGARGGAGNGRGANPNGGSGGGFVGGRPPLVSEEPLARATQVDPGMAPETQGVHSEVHRAVGEVDDGVDLFDIEEELEGMIDEDIAEVLATFVDPLEDGGTNPDGQGLLADDRPVHDHIEELQAAAAEEGDALGLGARGQEGGEDALSRSSVAGAVGADDTVPPAAPLPQEPRSVAEQFGVSGPSGMGYVCHDGKTVMRIQRGNPKGSLSVRCYRHTRCSFLLSLKDAPEDDELIRWCFAVRAKGPGDDAAETAKLAQEHLRLVEKWRPSKKPPAAKHSRGAASSKD